MTIVKPLRLGLIGRARQEPPKTYYFVAALGCFDLLDPGDFDLETTMWPAVAGALGATPLDVGMPKPWGEVLVAGDAVAPGGTPVTQMRVEFAVGPVRKRMAVFGDRHWELTRDGPVFTSPLPFARMPLTWDRAFGGPGFPANPAGTGHAAGSDLAEGRAVRLPNIEDESDLILDIGHSPRPVGCFYVDVMAPSRQRYTGTYDAAWLARQHPGHPEDFDWAFYNAAPVDQWAPGFFTGDERIRIAGMHADHPLIDSRLPGMRVRAFLNLEREGGRVLTEIEMRCETVVLLPGQLKGVVIYRGGREIDDIDGKDVADTLLAYERLAEPPRSAGHYARELARRTDPATAGLSFFDDKPLRPDLPEDELARREAERAAVAEAAEQKWDKRVEATIAQAYRAVGALPPPPGSIPKPKPPVKLPTISPGDIARNDIDMAGVAAALAELKAYGDGQIAAARQQAAKLLGEVAGLVAGAGGKLVDAASAGRIAAAAAAFPAPAADAPPVLPPGAPTLDSIRAGLADQSADPFAAILDAVAALGRPAGPLGDEEKAVLLARAQGRPEGLMTASLTAQLKAVDLTAGGRLEAPRPVAAPEGVEDFLKRLGLDGSPAGTAPAVRAAGDKVAALGAQAGLVAPLLAAAPPAPAGDGEDPLAAAMAVAESATAQIETAFGSGRRMSPEPIAPVEPLRAEAAVFLGQAVRDCLRAGGDFSGRDWCGAILAGADFSGLDLRGVFFEKADLTGAVFRGANLQQAVFTGAVLAGADLSGCAMCGANLSRIEAAGACFAGADLTDAMLIGARLTGADLARITLENAIAMNAELGGADLTGARLAKVIFLTAKLDGAVLDDAVLDRCIFLEAAMSRVSARGAVFDRCSLLKCEARDGDFTGADFTRTGSLGGTVYDGSVLRDIVASGSGWHAASLAGVDLHAARLDGSDLSKADLRGARLTRASLRRAVLLETNLAGADAAAATFLEAQLRRVDLSGGSLRHANLYRANIDATALAGCDLTGVNAQGTNLMRASDVAR